MQADGASVRHSLDSGVRVVAQHRPRAGYVSLCAAYDVGAQDDPLGAGGMAHLCEHVLFRQNRDRGPGPNDRTTQAATAVEHTTFTLSGRPDQLPELVDECVRRLTPSPVSAQAAAHHKAVVRDEIRQKSATAHFGSGLRRSLRLLFGANHPLGRPPVGLDREVDRIGAAQIEDFIGQHHRPHRLVLAAAGSVDPGDFARICDGRLGPRPAGRSPGGPPAVPHVVPPPAPPTSRREDVEEGQPTGLVRATFALPSVGPDAFAAELAFAVLAKGSMSLLLAEIGADGALGATAEYIPHATCPSLGIVRVNVVDEQRLEHVVESIGSATQRLADGHVTRDLVTGAARRIDKEARVARMTATGCAAALARDTLWELTATPNGGEPPTDQGSERVQKAARNHLRDPSFVVFHPADSQEVSWMC